MIKRLVAVLCLLYCITNFIVSQELSSKDLYSGGVYGQTFMLTEDSDGKKSRLLLIMCDNKSTLTRNYDSELPTAFFIWSKWFSNPSEYADAVESTKDFFNVSMNYVYLADMKDICDIASCCELKDYRIKKVEDNKECIFIEYVCSDLNLLFDIAYEYNRRGRAYILRNYVQ